MIQLIVLLAPYGVQLVQYLIEKAGPALAELLVTHDAPTLAAVSAAIIDGINNAHPEWPDEKRASYAADAINQWKVQHPTVCASCHSASQN